MQESEGDPRYYRDPTQPLITPERAAKGDVLTGPPCPDCGGSGKVKAQLGHQAAICRACRGRGWIGTINAASIAASEIRFAQVQVRNILNYLWEEEIISDDEHDAGHTFEAWRNQHRVSLGLQKSISGDHEETFRVKLRAYGFVLLIRRLSAPDVKAINKSLDVSANFATQAEALREQRAYRAAYRNLTGAVIPIRERISYLESASQEERDYFSAEQMKNLLALIKKDK